MRMVSFSVSITLGEYNYLVFFCRALNMNRIMIMITPAIATYSHHIVTFSFYYFRLLS
jgi:hypothetical protein